MQSLRCTQNVTNAIKERMRQYIKLMNEIQYTNHSLYMDYPCLRRLGEEKKRDC